MGGALSDRVTIELKTLHRVHGSWSAVQRSGDRFSDIPRSTLSDIAKTGHVPNKWADRFDAPMTIKIGIIDGEVPEGEFVIVIGKTIKKCPCGQLYFQNHPRRKVCPVCSKYRGR